MRMHPPVLDQAGFGISPKSLDAIDVGLVCSELILSMVNPQVLSVTDIHKAIVASPAIRVDDTVQTDLSSNNPLQSGLGAIGDYFGVHVAITFEDAEDDSFSVSSSCSFAPNATSAEERLVNFYLPVERGSGVAELCQTNSNGTKISINRVATQTRQGGDLRGIEINRKQS